MSFTYPAPQIAREPTGEVVGRDVGIAHTATLSTGKFLDVPRLLSKGEAQR